MTKALQLTLTTAIAAVLALPAAAQIANRTITVSNGVAETHPVGNGVEAMRACITLNATAGTLDRLVFDEVMPAAGLALQEHVTRYTTFDGLAVTIGFAEHDGKLWSRYTAAALDDAAKRITR